MKKSILKFSIILTSLFASTISFAGVVHSGVTVVDIYQLNSDETVFEFHANVSHSCGSNNFRVKSPNVAVANRKFSMVMAAFMSGKKITMWDIETCESGRTVVEWIRLDH